MGTQSKKGAKTTKEEKLQKNTNKAAEAKITEKKELKYIYPASCEEGKNKDEVLVRRKAFRQSVRAKIARFEKNIAKLEEAKANKEKGATKKLRETKKEFQAYMEEVYTPSHLEKIAG